MTLNCALAAALNHDMCKDLTFSAIVLPSTSAPYSELCGFLLAPRMTPGWVPRTRSEGDLVSGLNEAVRRTLCRLAFSSLILTALF